MKYLTLSFDDGTVQDRRFVGILNRYGIKCTFNLNSGLFSKKHNIIHEGIDVCHDEIDPDEVRTLYAGHEVAAHTITHPNLLRCTPEQVIREVRDDALALEALCGVKVTGMAYPGRPFFDETTIRLIRENTDIIYARTVASHFTLKFPERLMTWDPSCYFHPKQYAELDRLTDEFISSESEDDLLLYVWGHSFELDKFDGAWDKFERFCEKIGGRDDIRYVTNREVAAILPASARE